MSLHRLPLLLLCTFAISLCASEAKNTQSIVPPLNLTEISGEREPQTPRITSPKEAIEFMEGKTEHSTDFPLHPKTSPKKVVRDLLAAFS